MFGFLVAPFFVMISTWVLWIGRDEFELFGNCLFSFVLACDELRKMKSLESKLPNKMLLRLIWFCLLRLWVNIVKSSLYGTSKSSGSGGSLLSDIYIKWMQKRVSYASKANVSFLNSPRPASIAYCGSLFSGGDCFLLWFFFAGVRWHRSALHRFLWAACRVQRTAVDAHHWFCRRPSECHEHSNLMSICGPVQCSNVLSLCVLNHQTDCLRW